MTYRGSFSQCNMFDKYPRQWFFQYILKIPFFSDMCYANAGSAVHHCLEKYYQNKNIDLQELKNFLITEWLKYKLEVSKINHKQDEYWGMVLNSKDLNLDLTSTELKIFFDDALAYIDGVNTNFHYIYDHKTSTRSEENEVEYRKQVLFYAWMYYRKFNIIPKKCVVCYLKYSGTKGIMEFEFNENDIKEIEQWYNNCLKGIEQTILENKVPNKCKTCNFFCPYKEECNKQDNEFVVNLTINNSYVILNCNITELLHKGLNKKYSYELKNSFFIKKKYPNANTTVKFWNNRTQSLPIGFYHGLIKTLNDYCEHMNLTLKLNINDNRKFNNEIIQMPDKFINNRVLRDYQNNAVDEIIKNKIGLCEIATGGGKTEIAIETIRRLQYKTLFVVDKKELMKQTINRMKDSLGIEIGQIGSGVYDVKHITVATIQTLIKGIKNKNKELIEYLSNVRVALLDECHKIAAKSYLTLSRFINNCEYRIGFSGTGFRDDGEDMKITSVVGYKISQISAKELIEKGFLMRPNVFFIKDYLNENEEKIIEQQCQTGLINEIKDYSLYYQNYIVNNKNRNQLILDIINQNQDKKILILVKLIDHGLLLEKIINNSRYLYGETNKNDREDIFNKFVNGDIKYLISTISIFAEGIDIPSLDVVINASANKGNVKTIQILGRVIRKLEGKQNAQYIDFIDYSNFFKYASLSRKKSLQKQEHNVEVISKEKFFKF
jgi:superfamily II DNA or RNA helicase